MITATSRQRSMLADAVAALNEFATEDVTFESLLERTEYTLRELNKARFVMVLLYRAFESMKEETGA